MKAKSTIAMGLIALLCSCVGTNASKENPVTNSRAKTHSGPPVLSPVSGLPEPGQANKAKPSGKTCDLKVLDWAGYQGAASLTFDDGQPSHISHWPDLKALGVPMTFYLTTNNRNLAGYEATWKEALALGHEIGNHTDTHKKISDYGGAEAVAKDIATADAYINDVLGSKAPRSFAYPFGELGWRDSFEGRFLLARTVFNGTILPLDRIDPLELPIFAVQAGQDSSDFDQVFTNSAEGDSWVIFMFHSLLPGDNWYAGVKAADLVASTAKARDGGKVWIDSVINVGSYWMGQIAFAAEKPKLVGEKTVWAWSLPQGFPQGKYLRVTVSGGTLSQGGQDLPWNAHGYYEVALDQSQLEWRP